MEKDEKFFYKCEKSWPRSRGNLSIHCINCSARHNKEQRERHREKRLLWDREYYRKNKKSRSDQGRARRARMKIENPARYRAYKFFSGPKRKDVSPELTRPYLENKFSTIRDCQCCGKNLVLNFIPTTDRKFITNFSSPSIDRVDNSKGYSKNNIGIICWQCNQRKTDLALKDLDMFRRYIEKYAMR